MRLQAIASMSRADSTFDASVALPFFVRSIVTSEPLGKVPVLLPATAHMTPVAMFTAGPSRSRYPVWPTYDQPAVAVEAVEASSDPRR